MLTEQVPAAAIVAGNHIIRDGVERTVTEAIQTVPRQTVIHLDGGGMFTVGKRAKLDRVIGDEHGDAVKVTEADIDELASTLNAAAPPPAPPVVTVTVPSPRTVALSELQPGDFVRWHMLPHRVADIITVTIPEQADGHLLHLEPWLDAATTEPYRTAGPFTDAARFVTLDNPDRVTPAAAVETMRPTAANVGSRAPAADEQIIAENEALTVRGPGLLVTDFRGGDDGATCMRCGWNTPTGGAEDCARHIEAAHPVEPDSFGPPVDTLADADAYNDRALKAIPDFVQRANAAEHVDVTAAGQAIRDRGGPVEQVRPGSAIPVVAEAGEPEGVTPAPGPDTYTLVVEVFRPTITAAVYPDTDHPATLPDAALSLVEAPAPMVAEDAAEACRDTLDRVDRQLDDVPGWAAAGPWHIDGDSGFLIVCTRPVRRV